MATTVDRLAAEIRACRICLESPRGKPLPHTPRPVLRVSSTARLAIVGQAPGVRVHESGIPFSDRSGDRLRDWMAVSPQEFYDTSRIAIVPMGFCFPGHDAKGGDLPPRRECAAVWRKKLFARLPQIELMLLVGIYAQRWHLGAETGEGLTQTVRDWRRIAALPGRARRIPLPHPSWRNNQWLKDNPWFDKELLPELRKNVRALLIV